MPSSSLSKNIKIKIYRTMILSIVVYVWGGGACSVTLREERRLRVFEHRVLRKILGLKRDEVRGVEKTNII